MYKAQLLKSNEQANLADLRNLCAHLKRILVNLTWFFACRVQAVQRAGRAGRTRPGKCYRLYTAKFFERDMPNVAVPEIQRTSLLTTVLSLKSLPLPVDVLAFDFLDAPTVRLHLTSLLDESARCVHRA